MLLYTALLLTYGLFASAQRLILPTCSQNCVRLLMAADNCDGNDLNKCRCNSSNFLEEIADCIKSECSSTDQASTNDALADECASIRASGESSSSLSKGAIAGISIGAALGIALVILGAYFFWRRRRGRSPLKQIIPAAPEKARDKAEMDAPTIGTRESSKNVDNYYEMDGTGQLEMDGRARINELEDRRGV